MSKLDERRKKYDIPPPPYQPIGKCVLIWRILPDQKSAGGIIVPEAHQHVKSHGILLAAGLTALDVMADHLIELGDEVYFGHYAGRDRQLENIRAAEKAAPQLLECKIEDVIGSVDALERLSKYEVKRVEIDTLPETTHVYRKKGA